MLNVAFDVDIFQECHQITYHILIKALLDHSLEKKKGGFALLQSQWD
jgi:hypothetical protein